MPSKHCLQLITIRWNIRLGHINIASDHLLESININFFFLSERRFVLTLEPNDYITSKTSIGDSYITLYVKGVVMETEQSFATQYIVELTLPTLKVQVSNWGPV